MMKKALKIIAWILLALVALAGITWFGFLKPEPPPISAEDRVAVTLMPLPAELKLGKGTFLLDEGLAHEFTGLSTGRLERAVDRFYDRLSRRTGMKLGLGNNMQLILECTGEEKQYPSLEDDESYSMKVSGNKIVITAPGETGILFGLETLLQLAKEQDGTWGIPVLALKDQPRYPWRGLMIDACRHWMPKEVVLRNLDAMASMKLNVFHWHLTENQAFRVESKLFPELQEMGSMGNYYTQEDIREVVAYAADRAIRVIPEFDVPGHTGSWFVGHPELASGPGPYTLDGSRQGPQPVMDPTREEVYDFLDQFFSEMMELFPDKYFHIGGDEVVPTQWNQNPEIQSYMKEHGLEDAHALQAHFNTRLQKMLSEKGKIMIGWDEILHPDLPREGIAVQTWRDQSSLWDAARQGYRAILSAGYYLDYKQPAGYHYHIDPAVIPGAVEIEIDPGNWKGWDCVFSIAEMEMEGELYLFGEGDSLRGILSFMDVSMGFNKASYESGHLSFVADSPMEKLAFEIEVTGDSISGSAKISVFNLTMHGHRSGGSDMEGGAPLPEFRKIEPLTPEQQTMLLGGEACMWSEMVNALTIDSRIWPRTTAIAEKLWSPEVLTSDGPDMYRRLMVQDDQLQELGLMHRSYREQLLEDMVSEPFLEPLRTLAEVLQEDKMFARRAIYNAPMSSVPFNRMVDAAPAESYVAYRFGQDVDLWLETEDIDAWERMTGLLELWALNHEKLAPAMVDNDRLLEVRAHSVHLSELARAGLAALSDPSSLQGKEEELASLFARASESYGATNLPVAGHVKKLVESSVMN